MQRHHLSANLAATTAALGISDGAFSLLRDLIEQQLGIFYDEGKRDLLIDRVSQLAAAHDMQSLLDYYYALKYDDHAENYWSELRDRLAVPETYFWRQPEHFDALVTHIVPEHLAHRRGQSLRIWSAACCSGEEPLSIAMALDEAGIFDTLRIEIIASDVSPALIARAQRGLYGERSFRSLPDSLRERYFTRVENGWQVAQRLQRRIEWRVINLVNDADTAAVGRTDVAFCRNVMIYFSDDAIRRVAGMFARQIRSGGRLFLGAAESLTRFDSSFVLADVGDTFVYVNDRADRSRAMLGVR